MNKLIYFSFFIILPLDMFTGILLKFNFISGGSLSNPSVIFKILLLVLLFVNYLKIKRKIVPIYFIFYFSIVVMLNSYLNSSGNIKQDLVFLSYILNSALLLNYLVLQMNYFSEKIFLIIKYNLILTLSSILLSDFLGISSATYKMSWVVYGSKGLFAGGNIVSVFSIIFFVYFLFGGKNKILNGLALFLAILLKTKAIIIVAMAGVIFLFKRVKVSFKYSILTSIIFLISIPFFNSIIHFLRELYINSAYFIILKKQKMEFIEHNSIEDIYSQNRRIIDSMEQLYFQLSDLIRIVFGVAYSGQVKYWHSVGHYTFAFGGMDIFDFLFRYGIIGLVLFVIVFVVPLKKYYKKYKFDQYFAVVFFIYLYSIFGGYVVTSHALLMFLSLFMSVIYDRTIKNNYKNRLKI